MTDKLNDNDKERIEQASLLYSGNHNLSSHLFNGFIKGAEYATIYERQQQAKELKRLTEIVERTPHLNRIVFLERQLDERRLEKEKLEAERSELRNKVIDEAIDKLFRGVALNEHQRGDIEQLLNSLKTK